MKIMAVKRLAIPDLVIVTYARFRDQRGYFTETFRISDFVATGIFPQTVSFVQANESYSAAGTIRGLHFQWNPYMGKLVRTISGHMIDFCLDIRRGSPTFGHIVAYDMPARPDREYDEWIWVPPGFAHGNLFFEPTIIEYLCTGEYNQSCEAGISPFAADIDWSMCEQSMADVFHQRVMNKEYICTEKDRNGLTLDDWSRHDGSEYFFYDALS